MVNSIAQSNPTKQRQRENGASAFSDWLRLSEVAQLGLGSNFASVTDIDFVWFAHPIEEGWYITLEEKCMGSTTTNTQQDVLNIVSTHLLLGSQRQCQIDTWKKGLRTIEYRGHYLISFEKTNPNDSAYIKINGKKKTKDDLIQLLRHGKVFPAEVLPKMSVSEIAAKIVLSWDTGRQYEFIKYLIQKQEILLVFQEAFQQCFPVRKKYKKVLSEQQESILF
jgi:hypothetical protein